MKAESSQAGRRAFLANVVYLFIALPCLFTKLIFTCQREREREIRQTRTTVHTLSGVSREERHCGLSLTPAPHSKKMRVIQKIICRTLIGCDRAARAGRTRKTDAGCVSSPCRSRARVNRHVSDHSCVEAGAVLRGQRCPHSPSSPSAAPPPLQSRSGSSRSAPSG